MNGLLGLGSKAELLKTLVDNTPIAYVILDRDYRIQYVNKSFLSLRKLDESMVAGQRCYDLSNAGKRCTVCAVAKALVTGQCVTVARRDILPDGTVRYLDDYAVPLQRDASGMMTYVLEFMINRNQEVLVREQRNMDYAEIVGTLSALLEVKDPYTAEHSDHVRKLSMNLAKKLGLPPDEIFEISVAASLHDIGKVTIPDHIINKRGKLTDAEYEVVKTHSAAAYHMMTGLESFENVRNIALHHHERVDGKGYPDKLMGSEIELGARIIAVADTYDSIVSNRSYRAARTHAEAIQELRRAAGTQLDKKLVQLFISLDFDHLDDTPYQSVVHREQPAVKRMIQIQHKPLEDGWTPITFGAGIDTDQLLNEIFDKTPCGYIVMDAQHRIRYVNNYFCTYVKKKREELIGKVCCADSQCELSPLFGIWEKASAHGSFEYVRCEIDLYGQHKIFDLCASPLQGYDGEEQYTIQVIIDRMEEVKLQRARENDFNQLIFLLGQMLKQSPEGISDQPMRDKIIVLQERLEQLMEQKTEQ